MLKGSNHFPLTYSCFYPEFLVINLAKIYDTWYTGEELDEFEKRLLFLVLTNKEELSNLCKGDKIMEEARETLEGLNSEDLFLAYEAEAIERYGQQVDLNEAREEGIKENKIENAKKMLQDKVSISDISKWTGLSIKEIEKLKKGKKVDDDVNPK